MSGMVSDSLHPASNAQNLLQNIVSKMNQPELTERERSYLKKIGEAGRKTMNYDLDLCRRLERAELVIDKGRRFALTKLGQKIYQEIQ